MAALSNKDKKFLYHMTSIENLASIRDHGLLSRQELCIRGLLKDDVADHAILAGRSNLSHWVPFHFMSRTPFDYAVIRNAAHRTKRFVYLAVERSLAASEGWKIIPKHPLADGEQYSLMDWDAGIAAIDWHQLDKKGSWDSDHECKQACMAEALSAGAVPFSMIKTIYCRTEEDKSLVLNKTSHSWIQVTPGMFPGVT